MRTLLIDNYDSFTHNLYQLLGEVNGRPPVVVTNDGDWSQIDLERFDAIVISPGPGRPERPADFGISARAIRETDLPVLGVCLGHQGLCHLLGRRGRPRARADARAHLARPALRHRPLRGHPLAVRGGPATTRSRSPTCRRRCEVTAWTQDGVVMGVRHREVTDPDRPAEPRDRLVGTPRRHTLALHRRKLPTFSARCTGIARDQVPETALRSQCDVRAVLRGDLRRDEPWGGQGLRGRGGGGHRGGAGAAARGPHPPRRGLRHR